MANLGVNIDHVATLRQQRGTSYPNPIDAAVLVQLAGADQITVHLREDRRHIHDADVRLLKSMLDIPLNLEMGNTPEMITFALEISPSMVTLVPEKREERTTEGGLNLKEQFDSIKATIRRFWERDIPASLFIEPTPSDITLAADAGATMVELHTGRYADARTTAERDIEYARICRAVEIGKEAGLIIHAGHGLNYVNTAPIAALPDIVDLNIGHSIISRAVLVGLEKAVRDMKDIIHRAAKEKRIS